MTTTVVGLVLAAGASRRLGAHGPKQLLPWRGRPLVRHAAATLSTAAVDRTWVAVGHRGDEVVAALRGLDLEVVRCAGWAEGQSAPLRAALGPARDLGATLLVMPCDQPFLTARHLDRLVAAARAGAPRVATRYPPPAAAGGGSAGDATVGAPACFAPATFDALARLRGDRGARRLLRAGADTVDADDPRAAQDVDTWDDYRRLLALDRAAGGDGAA